MKNKTGKFIAAILFVLLAGILRSQSFDSLTVKYSLVNSTPQNASVFINDMYAGNTPLYWMPADSSNTRDRKFTLKMKGFLDYSFNMAISELPFKKDITLTPKQGTIVNLSQIQENKAHFFSSQRKFVPITLSALAMIAAGISAYYFKSMAIEKNDEYYAYGDPASLDKKKKYDLLGGISLGVFQAGLAAFAYFLFEKY